MYSDQVILGKNFKYVTLLFGTEPIVFIYRKQHLEVKAYIVPKQCRFNNHLYKWRVIEHQRLNEHQTDRHQNVTNNFKWL